VRKNFYNYLKSLTNTTVLIFSHIVDEAEKISDRVVFLNRGRIIENDKPNILKDKHGMVYLLQVEPSNNVDAEEVEK
jgi:ABC-type multidrug transport system ATPase subunit